MKEKIQKYFRFALTIISGFFLLFGFASFLGIENVMIAMFWLLPFFAFLAIGPRYLEKTNRKLLSIPAPIFGSTAILITLSVCIAIALDPLGGIPKIQDEINYFFQAKILNAGHVSMDSHVLADFFQYRFFVNDGKMYSLFQPGWPLLLGLGQRVGAAWIMGPLMACLSVGFFFGIGRRLFGEGVGRWAVISLITCSVFLFQSASMMAHGPALAFSLMAFYACLRGYESQQSRWFLLAGLSAGALFSIRAATAFALILPVAITGFILIFQKKIALKNILILALGFAPGALFQAFYNLALSGSIFTFPQDHYFNLTEATKNCHRMGIGKGIGCAYEHGPDLGKNGFTWQRAFEVTRIRLNFFRFDLFGVGFGAVLVFLPTFIKTSKLKYLIWAMPLSLILVYFFYYYHAESRYYFEGIPYCLLLIVLGFKGLLNGLDETRPTIQRLGYGVILATFFSLIAFNITVNFPTKWKRHSESWKHHKKVAESLKDAKLKNAVVLVPKISRMYWTGFWMNDADLNGDFIVALDHGYAVNTQLANFYPTRQFYKISHNGKLRKVTVKPNLKKITIQAESKFPVPIREHGYARSQSMKPWGISGSQLLFETHKPGAFMSFYQFIFEDGTYEVSAIFGSGPDYGIFEIEIDDQILSPAYDGFSPEIEMKNWKSTTQIKLKKGLRKITLRVLTKNPASTSFVAGIDKIVLEKVD